MVSWYAPYDDVINLIWKTSYTRLKPVNVHYVGDFSKGCINNEVFVHAYMFVKQYRKEIQSPIEN